MKASRLRTRAVAWAWKTLPLAVIFLLLLPSALPAHAAVTEILPPLALLAIVYWELEDPGRVGYGATFAAGLIQDALTGTPFGLSALLWGLLHVLLRVCHRDIAGQGFVVAWCMLAAFLGAVMALQWAVIGLYISHLPGALPTLLQWMLGVLCFPAMHAMLYRLERGVSRRYWYLLKAA